MAHGTGEYTLQYYEDYRAMFKEKFCFYHRAYNGILKKYAWSEKNIDPYFHYRYHLNYTIKAYQTITQMPGMVYPYNLKNVFKGTPFEYCSLDYFVKHNRSVEFPVVYYLKTYLKFPLLEQLVKQNMFYFALECLYQLPNEWSETKETTKAMLSVFRKCRYKVLATGTMTRNNVVEAAPQLELLYNNSIHYLARNEWIFRFRNGQMEKYENPFFNQPFPAYKKGYELFSFSYLPKKITVFGLEKANQDIYNASFLDELLEKTVITKSFEEVVGRKIYKIYQGTCAFNQTEKEVYLTAVKKFDKVRRKYFMACKNARKDAMFRILQQLMLLLKICAAPSLAYEYNSNEPPTKVKKAIQLLQMWEKERVAIGVRKIEVADAYYHYLKQAFPQRPIFLTTGKKHSCKQRQRIVEELRKTENGILLSTQQSLSESMNIDDVNKIILPELHYNHAAMEQYYFRFIRYTSRNFKQVVFLTYENSIEVNLLKMILAKEKINLFMKNQFIESEELYEKFGINPQIFSLLMTTGLDQDGKLQIQWGDQKIS